MAPSTANIQVKIQVPLSHASPGSSESLNSTSRTFQMASARHPTAASQGPAHPPHLDYCHTSYVIPLASYLALPDLPEGTLEDLCQFFITLRRKSKPLPSSQDLPDHVLPDLSSPHSPSDPPFRIPQT